MAKSVVWVHHASRDTMDGTSLVYEKKLSNKIEQFDAIWVLIKRTYFPKRGVQKRGLTNLHHDRKCKAS